MIYVLKGGVNSFDEAEEHLYGWDKNSDEGSDDGAKNNYAGTVHGVMMGIYTGFFVFLFFCLIISCFHGNCLQAVQPIIIRGCFLTLTADFMGIVIQVLPHII